MEKKKPAYQPLKAKPVYEPLIVKPEPQYEPFLFADMPQIDMPPLDTSVVLRQQDPLPPIDPLLFQQPLLPIQPTKALTLFDPSQQQVVLQQQSALMQQGIRDGANLVIQQMVQPLQQQAQQAIAERDAKLADVKTRGQQYLNELQDELNRVKVERDDAVVLYNNLQQSVQANATQFVANIKQEAAEKAAQVLQQGQGEAQAAIDKVLQDVKQLQNINDQLKNDARAEILKLQEQNKRCLEKVQELRKDLGASTTEAERVTAERTKLAIQLKECAAALQIAQQNAKEDKDKADQQRFLAANCNKKLAQAQRELDDARVVKQETDELKRLLKEANDKVDEQSGEISRRGRDLLKCKGENEEQSKLVIQLKAQVTHQQSQITGLTKDRARLEAEIERYRADFAKVKTEDPRADLKTELPSATELKNLRAELQTAQGDIAQLRDDLEETNGELAEKTAELEAALAGKRTAETDLAESEEELKQVNLRVAEFKQLSERDRETIEGYEQMLQQRGKGSSLVVPMDIKSEAKQQMDKACTVLTSKFTDSGSLEVQAMCADRCWGDIIAKYMGAQYNMLYPLASQVLYITKSNRAEYGPLQKVLETAQSSWHKTQLYLHQKESLGPYTKDEMIVLLHVIARYRQTITWIKEQRQFTNNHVADGTKSAYSQDSQVEWVAQKFAVLDTDAQAAKNFFFGEIWSNPERSLYWRYNAADARELLLSMSSLFPQERNAA